MILNVFLLIAVLFSCLSSLRRSYDDSFSLFLPQLIGASRAATLTSVSYAQVEYCSMPSQKEAGWNSSSTYCNNGSIQNASSDGVVNPPKVHSLFMQMHLDNSSFLDVDDGLSFYLKKVYDHEKMLFVELQNPLFIQASLQRRLVLTLVPVPLDRVQVVSEDTGSETKLDAPCESNVTNTTSDESSLLLSTSNASTSNNEENSHHCSESVKTSADTKEDQNVKIQQHNVLCNVDSLFIPGKACSIGFVHHDCKNSKISVCCLRLPGEEQPSSGHYCYRRQCGSKYSKALLAVKRSESFVEYTVSITVRQALPSQNQTGNINETSFVQEAVVKMAYPLQTEGSASSIKKEKNTTSSPHRDDESVVSHSKSVRNDDGDVDENQTMTKILSRSITLSLPSNGLVYNSQARTSKQDSFPSTLNISRKNITLSQTETNEATMIETDFDAVEERSSVKRLQESILLSVKVDVPHTQPLTALDAISKNFLLLVDTLPTEEAVTNNGDKWSARNFTSSIPTDFASMFCREGQSLRSWNMTLISKEKILSHHSPFGMTASQWASKVKQLHFENPNDNNEFGQHQLFCTQKDRNFLTATHSERNATNDQFHLFRQPSWHELNDSAQVDSTTASLIDRVFTLDEYLKVFGLLIPQNDDEEQKSSAFQVWRSMEEETEMNESPSVGCSAADVSKQKKVILKTKPGSLLPVNSVNLIVEVQKFRLKD